MRRSWVMIVFWACTVLAVMPAESAEPTLAVIVNTKRSMSLDLEDVTRIYLKQRRFWADGEAIVPVNREPESPARETFSKRALGHGSAYFADYWNGQYFQGILPPVTLSSDEAVKRYVATNPDAIGYIDAREVDGSVHLVLRLE